MARQEIRPLRRGWTTGACAAAGARAAFTALLSGRFPDPVRVRLPRGRAANFGLALAELGEGRARAGILKDAGDDPDVTHGALIVAEIERVAAKGARAIGLPDNPTNLKLPSYHSPYWEPVWSTLEETNLTAVMHFGSGGFPPQTAPEAPFAVMITLMGTTSMAAATELVFSPVFHKHPNLKVAFSEGGVGWMPYLVERADYVWRKHKFYQNIHPTVAPSELFRRNISGCFIEDEVGMAMRHEIGIDNITWECDYPHSDSFWPKSRARAEEMLAGVPDEEAAKIVELNTRRWYAFPEAGFKSCMADSGWRPNDGNPPDYDYDEVMAGHGGVGIEAFMNKMEEQKAQKA